MSLRPKTQRAFLAVTALTVIAVTTVFLVYAILLATIPGGNVEVVNFASNNIYYCTSNATSASDWKPALSGVGLSVPWYAKLNMSSGGPTGAVTVTWTLKSSGGQDVSTTATSVTLTGSAQTIYASSNGGQAANTNWGAYTTTADTYHIVAVVTQP